MKPAPGPAWPALAGDLDAAEEGELLASLRSCDRARLAAHFPVWAHPGQTIDPADPRADSWRTWVLMAGRGFGKTLAGAEWLKAELERHPKGAEPLAIALVGATIEDARRVMVEGRSGLMSVAAALVTAWHPSLGQLHFEGGAVATLFSGASPDRLRGPEHHLAWCDELAKWERGADSWDMLQLGLRLGDRPRALITTTPKAGPLLTAIIADPDTIVTGGSTHANPHTPAAFKTRVHNLYAGTRLGAQEVEGQLLTDTPGALWTVELLTRCRAQGSDRAPIARQRGTPARGGQPAPCSGDRTAATDSFRDDPPADLPTNPGLPEPVEGLSFSSSAQEGQEGASTRSAKPEADQPPTFTPDEKTTLIRSNFTRICIGVDPPSGDGTCGIIACALDEAGIAHVLADHSVTARTPEGWASAVADAAQIHSSSNPSPVPGEGGARSQSEWEGEGLSTAPPFLTTAQHAHPIPVTIVAETNQGGRMVKAILHTADPDLHVKPVTARMSKADRAAPIAHLFEAGKVLLHGRLPELEAQLCGLIAGGGYEGPGGSPDRADAMVWALTELMLTRRGSPQVRSV